MVALPREWQRHTLSYSQAFERLKAGRADTQDIWCSLGQVEPGIEDRRFCLRTGRQVLFPDRHAAKQLGQILGTGTQYPLKLLPNKRPGDAEALVYAFQHALRHADPRQQYLFRFEKNGKLRGVLSESYRFIRNGWLLRVVQRAIPNGRLCRWRGDQYTIYGDVLLPDSIRQETDSEYAAMFTVANSEIGTRKLLIVPAVYRMICTNGMIARVPKGEAITQLHRGDVDLGDLERRIIKSIKTQTPHATQSMAHLLEARSLTTHSAIKPVFAQLSREHRLNKALATAVLTAWHTEARQTPSLNNTLFAIINSFTRAGQQLDHETWVRFDTIGGELAEYDEEKWERLVERAGQLRSGEVEKVFDTAV